MVSNNNQSKPPIVTPVTRKSMKNKKQNTISNWSNNPSQDNMNSNVDGQQNNMNQNNNQNSSNSNYSPTSGDSTSYSGLNLTNIMNFANTSTIAGTPTPNVGTLSSKQI